MESLNSHFWFHPHNNNNNNGLLRCRMNLLSPSCWSFATQVIGPAAAAAVEIRGVTESVFLLVKEELYWCGHHSSSSSNSILFVSNASFPAESIKVSSHFHVSLRRHRPIISFPCRIIIISMWAPLSSSPELLLPRHGNATDSLCYNWL